MEMLELKNKIAEIKDRLDTTQKRTCENKTGQKINWNINRKKAKKKQNKVTEFCGIIFKKFIHACNSSPWNGKQIIIWRNNDQETF